MGIYCKLAEHCAVLPERKQPFAELGGINRRGRFEGLSVGAKLRRVLVLFVLF